MYGELTTKPSDLVPPTAREKQTHSRLDHRGEHGFAKLLSIHVADHGRQCCRREHAPLLSTTNLKDQHVVIIPVTAKALCIPLAQVSVKLRSRVGDAAQVVGKPPERSDGPRPDVVQHDSGSGGDTIDCPDWKHRCWVSGLHRAVNDSQRFCRLRTGIASQEPKPWSSQVGRQEIPINGLLNSEVVKQYLIYLKKRHGRVVSRDVHFVELKPRQQCGNPFSSQSPPLDCRFNKQRFVFVLG